MGHERIDGRAHARLLLNAVASRSRSLSAWGLEPRICSLSVGDNGAVRLYARNQRRVAARADVAFEERQFPSRAGEAELLECIDELNADPGVTGVIIQRPVPAHLSIRRLQSAIDPLKDIEGMHPASIGNIVYNDLDFGPCTAMAAVDLLRSTGLGISGLEVVVVGHSEIVGKPIAFLLMAQGATVTVCHHLTRNLSVHSRRADAVFVAVGKPNLVTGNMIKPGAAVIDIGINRVASPGGGEHTVGDVDYDSCARVAGWITPVPGGVGPVTVAMLMQNAVAAAERQLGAAGSAPAKTA